MYAFVPLQIKNVYLFYFSHTFQIISFYKSSKNAYGIVVVAAAVVIIVNENALL